MDNTNKSQNSLQLLEILPGTLFFDQFMNAEGNSDSDEQINGQVRFRSTSKSSWLQDINVPNPVSINWEGEVMTNVEKNAKGDVFLEYVNKKRVVTVTWKFLTQVQYNDLLNHLGVDFRVKHQNNLYYRIKTMNPNGDVSDNNAPTNNQQDNPNAVNNHNPQLDTLITYLDGKHVGNVRMYHEGDKLLIGYNDVSLTFIER